MNFRNELKYLCSDGQLKLLETRIRHLLPSDPHAGADGRYTVRSVYFDDYQDSCYYENEDGNNNRKKFRIRLYNGNPEHLTLECKQKVNGKNHKTVCAITKEQWGDILQGKFSLKESDKMVDPLLNRFFLLYRTGFYRPKVIVEYERTPFIYRLGNVRVTFDRNISATSKVEDLLAPRLLVRPVMPAGMQLLEVKYDGFLPDYIYTQLQLENLQLTANSKYYISRRFTQGYQV